MRNARGQAAAELLIILAVSLAILMAIFAYTNDSIADINQQQVISEAEHSVNALANAANDVYRQGVGAKKKVFFSVPDGVDAEKSGIESDTFLLNVLASDVYAKPDVCLQGTLPTAQGGHWVWLTAQETCVQVGVQYISTDKTSSYVTMGQGTTAQDTLTVTNEGDGAATVFVNAEWTPTDVTVDISPQTFALGAGDAQSVTLTYTSNASAAGNYTGILYINAAVSGGDENQSMPLGAEVSATGTGGAIAVFPATRAQDLNAGQTDANTFQVCNNGDAAIADVNFSNSGDVGAWIPAISPITALGAGACQTADYSVTVPGGQGAGTYTGTITATDGTNSDTMNLSITVPGAPATPDTTPPVILLQSPEDGNTYTTYTVPFDYNVTDSDSTVASCELVIDGTSDQTDGTITEGTTQSFTKTFASNGTYTWDVNCTDSAGNEGTSGENRTVTVNATATTTHALFAPTGGTDSTGGPATVDFAALSTSNDVRDTSNGNWPKNNAGYSDYIEYTFSPNVPAGATVTDANITYEFGLDNASTTDIYAQLQVWDGTAWNDIEIAANAAFTDTDQTFTQDLGAILDTSAKFNAAIVRMRMYAVPNDNRKSQTDYVSLGVAYTN